MTSVDQLRRELNNLDIEEALVFLKQTLHDKYTDHTSQDLIKYINDEIKYITELSNNIKSKSLLDILSYFSVLLKSNTSSKYKLAYTIDNLTNNYTYIEKKNIYISIYDQLRDDASPIQLSALALPTNLLTNICKLVTENSLFQHDPLPALTSFNNVLTPILYRIYLDTYNNDIDHIITALSSSSTKWLSNDLIKKSISRINNVGYCLFKYLVDNKMLTDLDSEDNKMLTNLDSEDINALIFKCDSTMYIELLRLINSTDINKQNIILTEDTALFVAHECQSEYAVEIEKELMLLNPHNIKWHSSDVKEVFKVRKT